MTTLEAQIDGKTVVRKNIMRKSKYLVQTLALVSALVLGGSLSAKASITLDLQEATLGQKAEYGITAASTVGAGINNNEWIGIYQFSASGSGAPANPFWSTCLSPSGSLDTGPHSYDIVGFSAGTPGHNPASWSLGTEGDAGIQNAQYLWRLFSPTIIASGNADQGAALVLAMYKALYDSASYGVIGTLNKFTVTGWGGGGVQSDYTGYLAALNYIAVNANTASGSILRDSSYYNGGSNNGTPTPGAGQDMIFNVRPVPEPTTILAGAMLLLPFGASTLRILRQRNRAA